MTPTRIRNAIALCTLALAALAGAAVLFRFDPEHYAFYPVCMFHRTTGLLCPGCGSLRALHHLLHGEFLVALHSNALVVVALILTLCWLARQVARRRLLRRLIAPAPPIIRPTAPPPAPGALHPAWLWIALVVVLLFAVARNLPLPEAALLSPPALVR